MGHLRLPRIVGPGLRLRIDGNRHEVVWRRRVRQAAVERRDVGGGVRTEKQLARAGDPRDQTGVHVVAADDARALAFQDDGTRRRESLIACPEPGERVFLAAGRILRRTRLHVERPPRRNTHGATVRDAAGRQRHHVEIRQVERIRQVKRIRPVQGQTRRVPRVNGVDSRNLPHGGAFTQPEDAVRVRERHVRDIRHGIVGLLLAPFVAHLERSHVRGGHMQRHGVRGRDSPDHVHGGRDVVVSGRRQRHRAVADEDDARGDVNRGVRAGRQDDRRAGRRTELRIAAVVDVDADGDGLAVAHLHELVRRGAHGGTRHEQAG